MNTTQNNRTGVAIVGMAGRFPKARNVDEFWRNLCNGVEGISFFTDEELAAAGAAAPKDNPHYVKARGVLDGADLFDAAFFGMNPREAEVMDPQHRIFLECAWEALESAGCDPAKFDGAIGVFGGVSMNTYLAHNLLAHPGLIARLNEHQLMLGNDKDYLPTRVSYKLNLRGPSLNIQTACSTSLVAVCVACQNLLNYECDLALAGAVSITFPQKRGYLFQEGGIASPDGHCRAFDARAAGTVAGEGVGIVALKRLDDALADGDTIYAVIKGFAVNNDGSNKIGYTAPSVDGQAEVIATAQEMAGFAPETIGYIEAHGTGTPLGDPIEIEGLTKAFRAGTSANNFCALGSVKSNVGHLDTAAGVTGLIKTALALHHKKLPPSLHFESPNPKIDFAGSPFFVNAKLTDWKNGETPRRAGVSSFGIGGTNAHVVLEESPAVKAQTELSPSQLILLSAKTETALEQATKNLAAHLKQHPELNLTDVAYTLQVGRHEFPHRRAVVCRDINDAVGTLETRNPKRVSTRLVRQDDPPVVFMFPGQGAQQVNMGLEVHQDVPGFREQVDVCCEILKPQLGFDLRSVLYPEPEKAGEAQEKLTQTAVTQPALFTIEYALGKLWMDLGVQPQAMIGHSIGEYVAACLAGVFPLEEALKLVATRGRMMQQLPGGTMLAVRLPENELGPLLDARISLAAVNTPSLCVVSGPADAIEMFQRELSGRNIACTALKTSHAFHSAMMEPVLQSFIELAGKTKLNAPQIPFISNVTGTWITAEQATDPKYWANHLRQTVRFADGVAELLKDPARIFLEAGPGRTLGNLTKQHPARGADNVIVSSLGHGKNSASDMESLLAALGQLWLSGARIDRKGFYQHEQCRRVPLPSYPFERQRYFIEPAGAVQTQPAPSATDRQGQEQPEAEIVPIHHLIPPPCAAQTTCERSTIEILRTLLSDLSGLNLADMTGTTTFAEMGFESLFLTQLSLAIEQKTGVRVAFRDLLEEFSSLDALAAHIEGCRVRSDQARTKGSETRNLESETRPDIPASTSTYPLTEAQRELWFASQMGDAASCAYNECRLLHLRGALKENTLTAAVQALVDRHEALRVNFAPDGDCQHVHPELKVNIPLLDWSKLPAATHEPRLNVLQLEEAQLPFDLVGGPLLRAWLIRLEAQHHVLVLTVHHIVCDGFSLGILLRELAQIYSAEYHGLHGELAPPLQLGEYVRRQTRKNDARDVDAKFWLEQFRSGAPVLELPTDHPRPSTWTFEAARACRVLPASLGAELKLVSARHGGTLFTLLLAAYGTLLHRLSGQDQIVVGIPVADRAMDGGETLVGHCVNFLPLPLRPGGEKGFSAYLLEIQKIFLDAHEHQHCTFGHLLQKLNLPRDAERMPLVSVTFNVQRLGEGLKFFDLETELAANVHGFTNFDLGFNVTEAGGALQLDCRYNTSLFLKGTIQRWLAHFQTLLEGIVADSSQRIYELPMLTEREQQQILVEWNSTVAKRPKQPADKCLHQLFEDQVKRTPDAVAVVFKNQAMTYHELNRSANGLARHLRERGAGPDKIVALSIRRSLEMVIAVIAVLKAGGAYVPLDVNWPEERLNYMLENSRACVGLQLDDVRGALATVSAADDNLPSIDVRPDHLAYVIYTSGSTGRPKGVAIEHRNAVNFIRWAKSVFTREDLAGVLFSTSLCFDLSIFELFAPLCCGGKVILAENALELTDLPARNEVTLLNTVPSAANELVRLNIIPPSVRVVNLAGEPLISTLVDKLYATGTVEKVYDLYGPTETTTYSTFAWRQVDAAATIGRPIANTQIYLLDEHFQPVPPGVPGEIFIGGAGVARGYLHQPELTAAKFVSHPFSKDPGARLYKTGDLARWRPDGNLEFLGRADHQVKIRGHRIEPGEIESALGIHPAVSECVVLAREDVAGEKLLAAYVVAKLDQTSISTGELRAFLKTTLPDYMIPSAFVFLETLPLTPNGKLNREALPAPKQERSGLERDFVAPGTPAEEAIASIWCEVLHLERVGVQDNFFELGGHSLLMTQVISRLRAAYQIELPMRRFFESPTVAGLAAAIEELLVEEIERLSGDAALEMAANTR